MASWSSYPRKGLRSTRCPVHGALVVQRGLSWVWRCYDCRREAHEALRRLRVRALR